MVGQIYPTELQVNKANSFDTEAPISDDDCFNNRNIILTAIFIKFIKHFLNSTTDARS